MNKKKKKKKKKKKSACTPVLAKWHYFLSYGI